MAAFVGERWLSMDLRTLGLFRIAFGLRLIGGVLQDTWQGNLVAFFSNEGVLSNHFALFAPIQPRAWSLLFAFSTPGEVAVAFTIFLAVYILYAVGWKTRLMQILVIVCFVSTVNRNLLLQDGGSFVTTVLAVWTAFLPLGARFSLDARAARLRRETAHPQAEKYVSFVCFAVLVQLAAIYGFNAANKTGTTWADGSAVHYVLWQNRMNTDLAAFLRVREPPWLSPLLTRGTLIFEWAAPFFILTPIFQTWARRCVLAALWTFHLGVASLLSLGAFSYVMMIGGLLLLGPADWKRMQALTRRWEPAWRGLPLSLASGRWTSGQGRYSRGAQTFLPPLANCRTTGQKSGVAWFRRGGRVLAEGMAVVLAVAMAAELTLANPCVPPRFQLHDRPQWMAAGLHYLRIYQTWGMFSTDPPLDDGVVIVDATLADGSHVDPLTGKPPDFQAFSTGPWHLGHHWSEYMSYYPWERHRAYRNGLVHYALAQHARAETSAAKQIRSLKVLWLKAESPPPGERHARVISQETLVTYAVPDS